MTNNNELYHYGVLGMKWGVRHDRKKTAKAYAKSLNNIERDKSKLYSNYINTTQSIDRITKKISKNEKRYSKNKKNKYLEKTNNLKAELLARKESEKALRRNLNHLNNKKANTIGRIDRNSFKINTPFALQNHFFTGKQLANLFDSNMNLKDDTSETLFYNAIRPYYKITPYSERKIRKNLSKPCSQKYSDIGKQIMTSVFLNF